MYCYVVVVVEQQLYSFFFFQMFLCRNMTEMMTTLSLQIVGVVEPIIQHADWFFPGGGLRFLLCSCLDST